MWDLLGWLVALSFIGLMIWAIARDNRYKRNRTREQYERDLAETRESMMRAGMLEMDKFFGNVSSKRVAVEYLKDEEQGMTRTGGNSDNERTTVEK
jgi:hypothetical protein